MDINDITGIIVDAAVKVHTAIGPGCFERIYEETLYYELYKRNLNVQRQVMMPIKYEELYIPDAYKVDLLVEQKIIVELKCVEHVLPLHFKQLMTYLNLMNIKNGMLLILRLTL